MADQEKRTVQMPDVKGSEWTAPTTEVKEGRLAPGKQYQVSAEFARYLVAHKGARYVEKGKPTDETADKFVIDSRPGQEKWDGWAERRAEEVGVITPTDIKNDIPPPPPPPDQPPVPPIDDPHPTDPLPPPSDPSDEQQTSNEATATTDPPTKTQTASSTSKTRAR